MNRCSSLKLESHHSNMHLGTMLRDKNAFRLLVVIQTARAQPSQSLQTQKTSSHPQTLSQSSVNPAESVPESCFLSSVLQNPCPSLAHGRTVRGVTEPLVSHWLRTQDVFLTEIASNLYASAQQLVELGHSNQGLHCNQHNHNPACMKGGTLVGGCRRQDCREPFP